MGKSIHLKDLRYEKRGKNMGVWMEYRNINGQQAKEIIMSIKTWGDKLQRVFLRWGDTCYAMKKKNDDISGIPITCSIPGWITV